MVGAVTESRLRTVLTIVYIFFCPQTLLALLFLYITRIHQKRRHPFSQWAMGRKCTNHGKKVHWS